MKKLWGMVNSMKSIFVIEGHEIRLMRKNLGLTQQELSRISGVSIYTISCFENGVYRPRYITIRRIVKAIEELMESRLINVNNEKSMEVISNI